MSEAIIERRPGASYAALEAIGGCFGSAGPARQFGCKTAIATGGGTLGVGRRAAYGMQSVVGLWEQGLPQTLLPQALLPQALLPLALLPLACAAGPSLSPQNRGLTVFQSGR
ncbi:hypothetical protein PHLH3_34560 [Pseudomonas sp. St386]|nr:hypothetical protein PHLH3_34560 [Pseudomonas sp. St386]